ncbi:MAG TPA: prepilin-type N-terminal cleavage/methylation domain-containing protein [Vicinamibacterales bacterium]|nr:prepilin-type N-terminal cleavage/methylation domain-containing protein [Vicinamibacterales bacterium]
MRTGARGFSLVEVLIATTITVVGLTGLAHLFVVASAANRAARVRTMAVMLARDKMEELLGGDSDIAGGVDFIGGRGEWLGDSSPTPGVVFVRRWSVSSGSGLPPRSRLVVVWLTPPNASNELARLVGAREGRSR